MAFEQYPPSGYEDHPYGVHVTLEAGADMPARILATVAAFRAYCVAEVDAGSGTTLSERLVQDTYFAPEDENGDFPLYQAVVQTLQDQDDIDNEVVDLWTAIPLDGRGGSWPSVAADKALLDSILAVMAPL